MSHKQFLLYYFFYDPVSSSVGGIMVSIAAFQAVDPSSILGHRRIFTKIIKIIYSALDKIIYF